MFNYQEMHHEKQSKPEVVIYWVTTNQIKRRARFNSLQRVKEILRDAFILYIYIVCASYVQLSTLVLKFFRKIVSGFCSIIPVFVKNKFNLGFNS